MSKFKYLALVVLTTLLMGAAFPVGKMGLAYATPFLLMGIRFVLAGGLLALFVAGKARPRGGRQWMRAAVVGLFQSAGVMGCAYYSMHWITSGESSVITSTSPLMLIVIGTLLSGTMFRVRQWLGVAIGFAGVVFSFGVHMTFSPGIAIGFAGAVSFTAATLLVKRWGPSFDLMVLAAYQMLAGGIVLLLLSVTTEHPHFDFSAASATVVLILVVLCSIVQFSIWFYLLRNSNAAKTSAFLFLVPVFGVVSSWILLGEKVQWYVGVGGVFICAGIYLVNWEGKQGTSVGIAKGPALEG